VIISPSSAHTLRTYVVGDNVVVVVELPATDCANAALLSHLPVQQLSHLSRRSQFPVSSRVMRIFDPLNSKTDQLGSWDVFAATAEKRFVDWAQLIRAKSHGIPLIACEVENGGKYLRVGSKDGASRTTLDCYNFCPRRINVEPGESSSAVEAGT
jgi:hypothetical protein